ncbi:hypothetical protein DXG01_008303, partial [Tephrocybe rancida]
MENQGKSAYITYLYPVPCRAYAFAPEVLNLDTEMGRQDQHTDPEGSTHMPAITESSHQGTSSNPESALTTEELEELDLDISAGDLGDGNKDKSKYIFGAANDEDEVNDNFDKMYGDYWDDIDDPD